MNVGWQLSRKGLFRRGVDQQLKCHTKKPEHSLSPSSVAAEICANRREDLRLYLARIFSVGAS
jgi:hypothetical protein